MKLYDFSIFIIITIISVCALGGIGSVYFFGPDNEVEEIAEAVIEKETGVDVDLTPKSKEKKFKKRTWKENPLAKSELQKSLACNCDDK